MNIRFVDTSKIVFENPAKALKFDKRLNLLTKKYFNDDDFSVLNKKKEIHFNQKVFSSNYANAEEFLIALRTLANISKCTEYNVAFMANEGLVNEVVFWNE